MKYKFKMKEHDYHKMCVIAHMIGQVQECDVTVETSHVASWLNVTKPTAIKYLKWLENNGMVVRTEYQYRKNAIGYKWHLTDKAWSKFIDNAYLGWYRDHKAKVELILQTKGNRTISI